MDHRYIDEEQIADRYLRGRLSEEESARFEEHFVGCPECQDRLELAEAFREGLEVLDREGRLKVEERAGPPSPPLSVPPWKRLAPVAAGLLLVAAIPVVLLLHQNAQLRQDLGSLREDLRQRRSLEVGDAREEWPKPVAEQPPGVDAAAEMRTELERRELELSRLSRQLAELAQPRVNTPIHYLETVRSGDDGIGRPDTLILTSDQSWLVLAVELALVEAEEYEAVLFDSGGEAVWQGGGLKPDRFDTLTAAFPSDFFGEGDYLLVLRYVTSEGETVPVSEYSFRVVRHPAGSASP